MKILIIEDEPKTGQYLRQGLTESGFIVNLSSNGLDGLHHATSQHHDLIILDVMLPDLNGWQILAQLRKQDNETPVIFLTARDKVEDRIKGLELGADDYLIKPFSFSELLARLRAILKRGNKSNNETNTLCIADLELDFLRRKVQRAGQNITLTAKEFNLLEFFMRHQGEVLSRALIASEVWDMNFDSDTNVIDVSIRRLRNKIDTPFDTKLLQTMRGMGYVLEVKEI